MTWAGLRGDRLTVTQARILVRRGWLASPLPIDLGTVSIVRSQQGRLGRWCGFGTLLLVRGTGAQATVLRVAGVRRFAQVRPQVEALVRQARLAKWAAELKQQQDAVRAMQAAAPVAVWAGEHVAVTGQRSAKKPTTVTRPRIPVVPRAAPGQD